MTAERLHNHRASSHDRFSYTAVISAEHTLQQIDMASSGRGKRSSSCPLCFSTWFLQELTEEELVQVLTGPKNALYKQYQQLFSLNKASFGMTQGALRAIARKAQDRGTGTRSLRSIMEGLLTEAMFDVPELGPAAAARGERIAVLLDEQGVMDSTGARIVSEAQLQAALGADTGAAAVCDEPIAAEVR